MEEAVAIAQSEMSVPVEDKAEELVPAQEMLSASMFSGTGNVGETNEINKGGIRVACEGVQ
jgi:hypothetical protein